MKHINKQKVKKTISTVGCIATVGAIGFIAGRKFEKKLINEALDNMARYGLTMSNVVDGVVYICQVVPKTKKD